MSGEEKVQNGSANVVSLSRFDRSRRGITSADALALLHECRDQLVSAIAQAWQDHRDTIEMRLLSEGEHTPILESRDWYFQAQGLLRTRSESLMSAFRRQLGLRLEQLVRPDRRPAAVVDAGGPPGLADADLSLVDDSAFEISLAISRVASRLQMEAVESLAALDQRLQYLCQSLHVQMHDNPFSPKALAQSFLDACAELDSNSHVQLILLQQYDEELLPLLPAMYQSLNRYLVSKEILPSIKVGMNAARRGRAAGTPASGKPDGPAGVPSGQAAGTGNASDLLALLQQLLTRPAGGFPVIAMPGQTIPGGLAGMPSSGIEGALAGSGDPASAPVSANVIASLTSLQHGQIPAGASYVIDTGRAGTVNILRDIRQSGLVQPGNQVDELIIDIVSMLFDYVFDEDEIPVEMKALIGRLQIPMLKVAMLDRQFFARKTHPARLLLDQIARLAMGWDSHSDQEGVVFRKLESVVDRIIHDFNDDLGIFSDMLEELEQFAAVREIEAEKTVGKTTEAIETVERSQLAGFVAQQAVDQVVSDLTADSASPLPDLIVEFVRTTWRKVLMEVFIRDGDQSERWHVVVKTMRDLLWSVTPKTGTTDRLALVAMLPGMLRELRQGMEEIHVEPAQREVIFSALVTWHSRAIRSGPGTEAPAAAVDRSGFSNVLSEVAAKPLPTANMVDEVTEHYDLAPEENIDLDDEDEFTDLARSLRKGEWLEFNTLAEGRRQVKLTWVSPMRGIYLFANSLGMNAITITLTRLAARLRSGEARVMDAASLTERAVDGVINRLQEGQGIRAVSGRLGSGSE